MFTATFSHNGYTGAVRTRNRKTPITEALYKSWIREAYPEIQQSELAIVALPNLPDPTHPLYADRQAKYEAALAIATVQYELGFAMLDPMQRFVALAARLTSTGAMYPVDNDGRMDKATLLRAFEDYLNELAFWQATADAIAELDKPITDVATRPPEALTEVEKADPLSDDSAKSRKKR